MRRRRNRIAESASGQIDLFGANPSPRLAKRRDVKRTPATLSKPQAVISAKSDPDTLLNVRQAAKRLGLSKSTVDKLRAAGEGPRFIRFSNRAIRYDLKDLDAWIEARKR